MRMSALVTTTCRCGSSTTTAVGPGPTATVRRSLPPWLSITLTPLSPLSTTKARPVWASTATLTGVDPTGTTPTTGLVTVRCEAATPASATSSTTAPAMACRRLILLAPCLHHPQNAGHSLSTTHSLATAALLYHDAVVRERI